jgi:hypothetical protein
MDDFIFVRTNADYLTICHTEFLGCLKTYFTKDVNPNNGSGAWGDGWGPVGSGGWGGRWV